jgi:1-acyl-sn-glycerol-3-phosphate acyltransferase
MSTFSTIKDTAKASAALLAISISTIVLTLLLCCLAIGKLLAPTPRARDAVRQVLEKIAESWISVNNSILSLYRNTEWDIGIPADLDRDGCYLVSCNHRSWVDILVLQRCFNRRLPLLRFFLKRKLIRVPFLGMAWWALDFPFMQRHSKEEIARRPELKGRDLENTRKACEKLRNIPVALMNFPEGTRFSPGKRDRGNAPYRNLLQPRIGGMGQVLYALGDQLDGMIDVTIVYPEEARGARAPSFWDLLSGRVPAIVVRARQRAIPAHLLGRNLLVDQQIRSDLEGWMDQLWQEKDALIARLQSPPGPAAQGSG